ncbi:hypothetical protein JOM56_007145 [Amanita muscaria]
MFFRSRSGYLPVASSPPQLKWKHKIRQFVSRRALRLLPLVVFVLGTIAWYFLLPRLPALNAILPPLYQEYRDREDSLPHYEPDAPYPNGRHAKYVFFANHLQGVGWGNLMQELLLNALLAYKAKRSFVFYNYEWKPGSRYAIYDFRIIPATVPLSAILSGPLTGGSIDSADVPRAVSVNHFREICPNRTIVSGDELRAQLQSATGLQTLTALTRKLEVMEDRCIEISLKTLQAFDYFLLGSKDVLDIWPTLSESPIITQFDWSPLIHSAFNTNRKLFETSSPHFSAPSDTPSPHISGLLAVHLRRGDFRKHCDMLAKWSSGFNGFNQFDELPDKFQIPPGGWGENTPENIETYHRHCYPSISQIVDKVLDVRRKVPGVDRLYIMTNGDEKWMQELTSTLETLEEWKSISSSQDLILTWEQKFVAPALDIYVAQSAQAFIGNGVRFVFLR